MHSKSTYSVASLKEGSQQMIDSFSPLHNMAANNQETSNAIRNRVRSVLQKACTHQGLSPAPASFAEAAGFEPLPASQPFVFEHLVA